MRKLLNSLYIMTPESYLSLDGENLVLLCEGKEKARVPLCNVENIICFNYMGVSPALMEKCCENNISLCFLSPSGKFLGRVIGKIKGSVNLRKAQFAMVNDEGFSLDLAKTFVAAKLHNCRYILRRGIRDHSATINVEKLEVICGKLEDGIAIVERASDVASVRGIEGECARAYFEGFDELILQQKDDFFMRERTKRPPLDNINAMLSFLYTVLNNEIAAALETVGLDPYLGFLHADRVGRASLASDLIEEFRAFLVDRTVLKLVNNRQVSGKDFLQKEGGAVIMSDETKRILLNGWQKRKQEIIYHPIIKEKIQIGLLPYVQALLLSKYIRGERTEYCPWLCR